MTQPLLHSVDVNGYALVRDFLTADENACLAKILGDVDRAGRRGLLDLPPVAALANSSKFLELVRPYTGENPFAVRAMAFNKSPEANWLVPWHQDLTIEVRQRRDVEGFSPWSIKGGVQHVQPPVELLEQMIAVRLHVDAADEDNGPLCVLPGTHRLGRLRSDQIADIARSAHGNERDAVANSADHRREVSPGGAVRVRPTPTPIIAAAGDALLLRPLLLHASARAANPRRRRVLHIEYAAIPLPGGLRWRRA